MNWSIGTLQREALFRMKDTWDDLRKLEFVGAWEHIARDEQRAPQGDWRTWLILAGRGFGKTRTGAEWIREEVKRGAGRLGLIGPTSGDVRDIMVEGESGLLSVCQAGDFCHGGPLMGRPVYQPTKRRVTWANGAVASLYSADEPERLRGPQHERIWADELCAWRYARQAFDMAMFGLRLGTDPRICVTTTPKPMKLIGELMADGSTVTTRGTTLDNATNLAPTFIAAVRAKYGGTRLGRQELNAEILEEAEGAMWTYEKIDGGRRHGAPELGRIVVAVDPPAGSKSTSDSCGIVAAGVDGAGICHVVADETLQGVGPAGWAAKAVALYERLEADLMIAEVNQGGDMVEAVIRQVAPRIALKKVHARRGKWLRAEPVSALYQQDLVVHAGHFPALEDEMCDFTPQGLSNGRSPDRLDALVWAVSELMLRTAGVPRVRAL